VLDGLLPAAPALGRWVDRPDVWLILADGSNMMMCVRDAAERIAEVGIPWLNRLSVSTEVTRCLIQEPNVYGGRGVILEMYGGALGSPDRWQKVGALAAATGDAELLRQAVDQMAGQRYWEDHPRDLDTLRAELAALN
jgi:hypothetical protein